jgi:predicted unusual protein kinase regulating ubiquinone biosynthesis (AarF/ABC1/UbiB family)
MLTTMGYLRGAAMKLGQTLANYPEILPPQIVETLERLHFEAPPMHFALLREMVRDELGQDPEDAFESFDTTAFAAASLGQVHRAVLKSGERVAVKIQYPGIARSIRADFRALGALLQPLHMTKAWNGVKAQCEDVRSVIERETDYEKEAEALHIGRALFNEDDGIVVPRVFNEFSTRRVLTMELVEGTHIHEFLAENPSQELRDHFGSKIYEAGSRLYFAGRLLYADPHPGNYLFSASGRLGFIDFGCLRPYTDDEWALCRRLDEGVHGVREIARIARELAGLGENEEGDSAQLQMLADWCRWIWRPYQVDEPFDFGDERYLQEGISLATNLASTRFTGGIPMSVFTTRWYFGTVAMLYRLRARVNVHSIYHREIAATGWNARGR